MAEPQSGLLLAWSLPRMRWQRKHLGQAASIWRGTNRPCLAAFGLLGDLACKPKGQGGRCPVTDLRERVMGKRSSFERRPADFYPTPRAAVVPLTCALAMSVLLPSLVPATGPWCDIWKDLVCAVSIAATSATVRMRLNSTITTRPIASSRIHPPPVPRSISYS